MYVLFKNLETLNLLFQGPNTKVKQSLLLNTLNTLDTKDWNVLILPLLPKIENLKGLLEISETH